MGRSWVRFPSLRSNRGSWASPSGLCPYRGSWIRPSSPGSYQDVRGRIPRCASSRNGNESLNPRPSNPPPRVRRGRSSSVSLGWTPVSLRGSTRYYVGGGAPRVPRTGRQGAGAVSGVDPVVDGGGLRRLVREGLVRGDSPSRGSPAPVVSRTHLYSRTALLRPREGLGSPANPRPLPQPGVVEGKTEVCVQKKKKHRDLSTEWNGLEV